MKNTKYVAAAVCGLAVLSGGSFYAGRLSMTTSVAPVAAVAKAEVNLAEDALMALMKNDQPGFERLIKAGGDLFSELPVTDGKRMTVAEGLSYFERPNFMAYLQTLPKPFMKQKENAEFDILSLAIPKNNPEMFALLLKEKPTLAYGYGDKSWTLLHLASAECSHKLVPLLKNKALSWNTKAKDGSTPLTLAAQHDCLPVLGFWKDQKADFNAKDGRGLSALSILRKKTDAALMAFVQSFEPRRSIASIVEPEEVNLYRKRAIPRDKMIDDSTLLEPELRPMDANETAESSEFSD